MKVKSFNLTLKYWKDGEWYVGQLLEVPGVMSQGHTLAELEANIEDAYQLLLAERKQAIARPHSRSKSIPILVHT
jgi:predicted RNase H-like HicB family nuclease